MSDWKSLNKVKLNTNAICAVTKSKRRLWSIIKQQFHRVTRPTDSHQNRCGPPTADQYYGMDQDLVRESRPERERRKPSYLQDYVLESQSAKHTRDAVVLLPADTLGVQLTVCRDGPISLAFTGTYETRKLFQNLQCIVVEENQCLSSVAAPALRTDQVPAKS